MTASHSSAVMLTSMRSRRMPALFTRVSRPPKVSRAARIIRAAPSMSETSSPLAIASPPMARISSTTCPAGPVELPVPSTSDPRSLTTTLAPWRANSRACSRPMPRPAPVTTTTRPSQIPVIAAPPLGRRRDYRPSPPRSQASGSVGRAMQTDLPPPPAALRADPLAGLNPAQMAAVTHPGGPLLVVAGAGSGKTRVLTHRAAWLIAEKGLSPFEVLAITFTNKAAGEMRGRLAGLIGPVAERMWVSTFHSACARILRRDAPALGYKPNFSIYDQADATRLVGYVVRDLGLDAKKFPPRVLHGYISAAKNELVDFETFARQARTVVERRAGEVYREYQSRLVAANAMDFDDLLLVTVNLLQACPDVLEHYRRRFRHVLVDEYQDTNRAQNTLVLLLAGGHRQVTVVGDSDQSVYGWRGADIRNILQFEEAFPDAAVVVLDQNYRSTQVVLDAANAVISNNALRKPKELWTDKAGGEPIVRYHAEDEHDEAAWVAAEVSALRRRGTASATSPSSTGP